VVREPAPLVPWASKPRPPSEDAWLPRQARLPRRGITKSSSGSAPSPRAARAKIGVTSLAQGRAPRRLRPRAAAARAVASWRSRRLRARPGVVLGRVAATKVPTPRYVGEHGDRYRPAPLHHALSPRSPPVTSRSTCPRSPPARRPSWPLANCPVVLAAHHFEAPTPTASTRSSHHCVPCRRQPGDGDAGWVNRQPRRAPQGSCACLSGQPAARSVVNNQVVLNLAPLITQLKETSPPGGLGFAAKIPTVNATFPLFEAEEPGQGPAGYRLIHTLRWCCFPGASLRAADLGRPRHRPRADRRRHSACPPPCSSFAAALLIPGGLPEQRAAFGAGRPTRGAALSTGWHVSSGTGSACCAPERPRRRRGRPSLSARRRPPCSPGAGGVSIAWVRVPRRAAGLRPVRSHPGLARTRRLLRAAAGRGRRLIFVFWGQPSLPSSSGWSYCCVSARLIELPRRRDADRWPCRSRPC